jgi:hypothetical protein
VPERAEDASAPVDPRLAAALVDVFVYVVVLNLFVEYLPRCSARLMLARAAVRRLLLVSGPAALT